MINTNKKLNNWTTMVLLNVKIRAVLIEFSFSTTVTIFSFNMEGNFNSNLEWYLNRMMLKRKMYVQYPIWL